MGRCAALAAASRLLASRLSPLAFMISFSQVTKRYPGGLEALKGVTLTIESGEMVFITGQSGAARERCQARRGDRAAVERRVIVNGQNRGSAESARRAVPAPQFSASLQTRKLLSTAAHSKT